MPPVFFVFGILGCLGALKIIGGIVSVLTKHQQRMAEIMHNGPEQESGEEIARLRYEVAELKQLVHQQMIALDSSAESSQRRELTPVQPRLEQF